MSRFSPSSTYRVEYLIVVEPRAAAPVLGYYNNQPIAAAVVDRFGRRYVYAGVAPRHRDGRYNIDVLAMGERLVEPGLVYCLEGFHKKVA